MMCCSFIAYVPATGIVIIPVDALYQEGLLMGSEVYLIELTGNKTGEAPILSVLGFQ